MQERNGDIYHFDGKVERGSSRKTDKNGNKIKPLNVLNVYSEGTGVCIDQEMIEEKTNEIAVIPEVIRRLNLKGIVCTWDAPNTQKETVKAVIEGKGDYVGALKGNQENFYQDVIDYFDEDRLLIIQSGYEGEYSLTREKSHSKIIAYEYYQDDNNFYMTHNYKKEYSADGSIFLDKNYDWNLPSSNLLLYGHNNKNGNMFQGLLEYEKESYYKEHPTIKFTTVAEDSDYEIIAVFKSRVYYKSQKDVFRYYYFINAENEQEYNNYVERSKKASLYDTGKTATYGDQLLTLSTCEYSQEDGRFVIVAKKIK